MHQNIHGKLRFLFAIKGIVQTLCQCYRVTIGADECRECSEKARTIQLLDCRRVLKSDRILEGVGSYRNLLALALDFNWNLIRGPYCKEGSALEHLVKFRKDQKLIYFVLIR